jgi:dienelactone hydrolase
MGGVKVLKKIKLITLFTILATLMLSVGCGKENIASSGQNLTNKQSDTEKVNVKKDIVYKSINDTKLKLDVYYALGNKKISKTPTVILIHGSSPDKNLKDHVAYKSWGERIAESGFNAVTFNWRPLTSSTDVSELIKYIRKNAKVLKINSEDIYVFAFSAGVYGGLKEAMQENTGFVKKVIAYYGQINKSILTIKTNVKLPSFFIAMGALDKNFPPNMNDTFISKAKESGCNITKMVHSKGGHGFDVFNASDDETKNIIDKTLKFIDDSSPL